MTTKIEKILDNLNEQLIKAFKNSYSFLHGKKVFMYGSGIYGRAISRKLIELQCVDNICAFINDFEHGFEVDGIPVKSLEECDLSDNYCVIVGIERKDAVVNKLNMLNINYHIPSYYDYNIIASWRNCVGNLFERITFYHENMKSVENLLDSFYADAESKRVIKSRIDFYNTGNIDYLTKYPVSSTSYFDGNYFNLSENEVFIDLGAYTGDTLTEFADYTANHYKKIISFEPDSKNFDDLKKTSSKYHNVDIYPYATGNQNCEVCFNDNAGLGSAVSSNGGSKVKMVRLDDIVKDIPTLIKMDVEGAELDTLKGAENLIKTYRPKLMVCIYHKVEDLYTIPNYLKTIVPDYRLSVRQQGCGIFDTVLYAEV